MLGILRDIWTRHLPILEFFQLVTSHTRRAVLATLTSVGLAGCVTSDDSEPPSEDELPDQCPTSRDLDVEWPRGIYTNSVRGFVTGYEPVGDFVTTYEESYLVDEHTTKLESASFNVEQGQRPDKVADGFHVTVSYTGSVSHREMLLDALKLDSDGIPEDEHRVDVIESALPDDPEYISIDEVENHKLREILKSAANSGYGEYTISSGFEAKQYAELISTLPPDASLNENFQPGAYFDINGTPVLLITETRVSHVSDILDPVTVRYYVSEYVIRRTTEENVSPEDGTVVECRLPK